MWIPPGRAFDAARAISVFFMHQQPSSSPPRNDTVMDALPGSFQDHQMRLDPLPDEGLDDIGMGLAPHQCHGYQNILPETMVYVFQQLPAELAPQGIILEYKSIRAIQVIPPDRIAHFLRVKNQWFFHSCRHGVSQGRFAHAVGSADPDNHLPLLLLLFLFVPKISLL